MLVNEPKAQLDVQQLESACAAIAAITAIVDKAIEEIKPWLKVNGDIFNNEEVIRVHADRLRKHAAGMAARVGMLGRGFVSLPSVPASYDVCHPTQVVDLIETKEAYDCERLNRLSVRDIQDAIDFDTELKDTFGFSFIDEEIREPLTQSLERLLIELGDASATVPGMAVGMLKAFLKACPRLSSRYYTGADSWPRSPAVIQVEIDYRMPDALAWLRYELNEALCREASLKANG